MFISDLAETTSTRLRTMTAHGSVRLAADAFADARVGLVVICDDNERATGVVSKSDLVRHLAAAGHIEAPITQVMTRVMFSASPADELRSVWKLMAMRRLQNLPVLGADWRPLGTLDIGDALQAILQFEEAQESQLVNYIAGNGYR